MNWSQIAAMPWMLWRRQVAAILRLELKKSLFSKRVWWIYVLTLGPVVVTALHSLFSRFGEHTLAEDTMVFAGIFQVYFPAATVWVWENLNPFLPSQLKKISAIFYLKSLSPMDVGQDGPLAILAVVTDRRPPGWPFRVCWRCPRIVLAYAAVKARTLEVSYSE